MAALVNPYARVASRAHEVFENIQALVVVQQGRPFDEPSRWRDDGQLHQALNNVKAAAQAWSMSCSKLALLVPKSPTAEILSSILDELLAQVDVVMVVFLQLMDCSLSRPLFDAVSSRVRSHVIRGKELLEMAGEASPDFGAISNAASIIFKLYDQIQDLPMTNKAAYRRHVMEQMAVVKDTIREFQGYVDAAASAEQGDNGDDNDEDEDEDEDEDDDEPYTPQEASLVQTCLGSMDCAMLALKAVLVIMTHVADAITPGADTVDAQDKAACDRWVGALSLLVKDCEDQLTKLGSELYAPFDLDNVRLYHGSLCTTLQRISECLSDSRYSGFLSEAHRTVLADLDTSRLAVQLAQV